MLAYAGQVFPNWNTTSEGDFGVMMLELFAYVGDILSFYGDRITQEAYLPTATQRLSLLNIASTLGYIPGSSVPASGKVTLQTIDTGPAVTIPGPGDPGGPVRVTTSVTPPGQASPPVYEIQRSAPGVPIVVPGNGGTATVQVLEGTTMNMVQVGTSDGTPAQSMALPQLGVYADTVIVFIQSGNPNVPTEWTQIDFLIDAQSDSTVFAINVDQNGVTWVTFGDSQNGMIPGIGLNVWVTYRAGEGSGGNVPSGSVSSMVQSVQGVQIALAGDGVTALSTAMGGGADPESNSSIRQNASLAFQAQYRAISPQDYTNLAYNVPGVLMANAVFGNANSVTLYVLGPNYAMPGWQLVDSILDYFTPRAAGGVTLSVGDPTIVKVDIGSPTAKSALYNPVNPNYPIQLQVKPKYSSAVVQANVTAALQALLSPPNVSFGQLLNVSDIFEAIVGVAGVNYVAIPTFTREDAAKTDTTSIQFAPNEVPWIGTINIEASGGL